MIHAHVIIVLIILLFMKSIVHIVDSSTDSLNAANSNKTSDNKGSTNSGTAGKTSARQWVEKLKEVWINIVRDSKSIAGDSTALEQKSNDVDKILTFDSIAQALDYVNAIACNADTNNNKSYDVKVLVTGSLYLVGDVLKVVQQEE